MTIKKPRRLIVDQPCPHSQKGSSSIEEKMFSKVTLPSTLINFFLQKMFARLRACLHGGGGPQLGEVTCGRSPHLSCKRDQIRRYSYSPTALGRETPQHDCEAKAGNFLATTQTNIG